MEPTGLTSRVSPQAAIIRTQRRSLLGSLDVTPYRFPLLTSIMQEATLASIMPSLNLGVAATSLAMLLGGRDFGRHRTMSSPIIECTFTGTPVTRHSPRYGEMREMAISMVIILTISWILILARAGRDCTCMMWTAGLMLLVFTAVDGERWEPIMAEGSLARCSTLLSLTRGFEAVITTSLK